MNSKQLQASKFRAAVRRSLRCGVRSVAKQAQELRFLARDIGTVELSEVCGLLFACLTTAEQAALSTEATEAWFPDWYAKGES